MCVGVFDVCAHASVCECLAVCVCEYCMQALCIFFNWVRGELIVKDVSVVLTVSYGYSRLQYMYL